MAATVARGVTACIPTTQRPALLRRTVESLLKGEAVPEVILISEASQDRRVRLATERELLPLSRDRLPARIQLLPSPPSGTTTGNRNWLARHVSSPLLLFLDDDVDTNSGFLADALTWMGNDDVGVVVAASTEMGGSGWLTPRGHFRKASEDDPIAIGLQTSLWRTQLFTSLWLDEAIVYGYEDADLSLRYYRHHPERVIQSEFNFVHLGAQPYQAPDRVTAAEQARCYVSIKRYAESRVAVCGFVLREVLTNSARRRRPLPSSLVENQWRDTVRFIFGGHAPRWAQTTSSVSSPMPEAQ